MRKAVIALGLAASVIALRDATACSCGRGPAHMMSPDRAKDVPINAHVRFEMKDAPAKTETIFRKVGTVESVPATQRRTRFGSTDSFELVPDRALDPSTQYEVGWVDPWRRIHDRIIGTFETGRAADKAAPVIDRIESVSTFMRDPHEVLPCGSGQRWIQLEKVVVSDPDRSDAQLSFLIWVADKAGKLDTKAVPQVVLRSPADGALRLGAESSCDPRVIPFATETGTTSFAIAVVDEAGNRSAIRTFPVDFGAAKVGK